MTFSYPTRTTQKTKQTNMNPRSKQLQWKEKTVFLLAVSFFTLPVSLTAQETAPAAPVATPATPATPATAVQEASDELIELSPFVVTGQDDVGYAANSTLAGTRLRSKLSDVGASISVVNKEFLQDTGSVDIGDVLLFTPNTEVSGLNGNYSGSMEAGAGNLIPEIERDNQRGGTTRIRGLAGADLTRDFFITAIPFDTYAVDRVEVQRGANSALFGLGSPGGIVNHIMITPDMNKNASRIRVETDQYGTFRGSFRNNTVLINDQLAITSAGLYAKKKLEQKEAWEDDTRIFASVNWEPIKGISLFGNIEYGQRDSARGDYLPPNDGITPWLQSGKQIFDSPAQAGNFFRTSNTLYPGVPNFRLYTLSAAGISSGWTANYTDPTVPGYQSATQTYLRRNQGIPNPFPDTPGEWMSLQPVDAYTTVRLTGYWPDGTLAAPGSKFFAKSNVGRQLLDRSIFDYRKHMFSGGSSTQNSDWLSYQIGARGTWLEDRLGLEVAYYSEDINDAGFNGNQGSQQRTIYIDTNRFLLAPVTPGDDGTGALIPNPGFGQPTMSGLWGGNKASNKRTDLRVTGFAELNAEDFFGDNKATEIIGRLVLTGVYEKREASGVQYYARDQVNAAAAAAASSGGNLFDPLTAFVYRAGTTYTLPVDGSVDFLNATTLSDLSGANIQPVPFGSSRTRTPAYLEGVHTWDNIAGNFTTFNTPTFNLNDAQSFPASFSSSKRDTNVDSQVLLGQYYFWDDVLVLTGSWRNDKSETAGVGAPGSQIHPRADNNFDPAFVTGPVNLQQNANEDTTSWSAMLHTPQFIKDYMPWGSELSIYYSEAENFQPTGGNVTILNDPIPPVTGSTTEQGFIITTLNGKLSGRFNWYETAVNNKRFDVGGVSSNEGILLNLVRQLANQDNIDQGFTQADVERVLPPQGVIDVNEFVPNWATLNPQTNRNSADSGTQDFVSTGYEFEITYNPTAKWTNLLSFGKQETITSNTYPVLQQYVTDFVLPTWVNSTFAQNYVMNSDSTETLAEVATRTIVEPVAQGVLQDGNPQIEQRKYRVTYNTSYNLGNDSFMPDWLGNVNVGGGIRWQDKAGIGFGVTQNSSGVYVQDVDKPIYGGELFNLDLFWRSTWFLQNEQSISVQLNVTGVTDSSNDLVPVYANPDGSKVYRFMEGRMFRLTGTWEF